jgi:hypothetical protein
MEMELITDQNNNAPKHDHQKDPEQEGENQEEIEISLVSCQTFFGNGQIINTNKIAAVSHAVKRDRDNYKKKLK